MAQYDEFKNLGYDDFRRRALDTSLSASEKIGFPNEYREGREEVILQDMIAKLPALEETGKIVIDIGPGCSQLPVLLIECCANRKNQLVLVDSTEMLSHLPDASHVRKITGRFPDCHAQVEEYRGKVHAVVCYSVIQYAFADDELWGFLDHGLALLAPGARMLIGDIPNASMRRRFLASEAGVRYHKEFVGGDEPPRINFNTLDPGQMDDAVVLGMVMRARGAGFHAFVVPQPADLPMANRREVVLIIRP